MILIKSYLNSIVLVRLWALVSRFLLIIVAAIQLTASDFGQWSLIIASVTLLSYLIGLDLYVPAVRTLYESKNRLDANATLWSLAIVYGLNFTLVCGVLIEFQQLKIYAVGATSLLLVMPFLFFEHLSAEANRELNLLGKHKEANYLLLIRSSFPIIIFSAFCFYGENKLSNILISQILGTSIALCPAWYFFKKYLNGNFYEKKYNNKLQELKLIHLICRKIPNLLKGCGLVFLTTCLLKASQTLDRQFLATLTDLSRVGAYALTMTAANAISSAIDAVIVTTSMSKLLDAKKHNNLALQLNIHNHLRRDLLYLSFALHTIGLIIFTIVDIYFYQTKYNIVLTEVALLFAASMLLNYSLADASLLFSLGKDWISLRAAILGFFVLPLTIFGLKNNIGENSVALGVFAASICIWLARKIPVDFVITSSKNKVGI
jgi:hypothetical protein